MNKKMLKENFDLAKLNRCSIAVMLTVPGQEGLEIIINPYENLDYKLDYYLNAYEEIDGQLVLTKNHEIIMESIFCTDQNIPASICEDYGLSFEDLYLGKKVKDIYTGLQGIVTSVCYNDNNSVDGYIEYLKSDGSIDRTLIDIERLEILDNQENN